MRATSRPRSLAYLVAVVAACGASAQTEDWLGRVQRDIARSEYEIVWQPRTAVAGVDGAYQAPNRAQGLRTYFAPQGIRVVPRTDANASWEWTLSFTGVGRPGAITPVERANLRTTRNRIAYDRNNVIESYLNDARGLEQGFMLRTRPAATGPVVIELALGGTLSAYPSADRQSIDFFTPQGVRAVHYSGLHVSDGTGRVLPAHMEGFNNPAGRGIRLVFDDVAATYPVTVDPLATGAAWTAEGDQASASFGCAVATAGDVNGDGYSDVIVGAYRYDNGQTDEGRAFVYPGSAAGLSASAAWTAESNFSGGHFGFAVATAGDVNGDGFSDVIVGAPTAGTGQAGGTAYVYLGSAAGLSTTAAWTAQGHQMSAAFGTSVGAAGDVNGDGYGDVIVGANLFDNGQTDEGRAFVFLGSASGLALTAAWTAEADQANAQFGSAVATAGDVNGDGYADVIVGAPSFDNGQADEGRVFVYHGSATGLHTAADLTLEADQASASFGTSVSTAGDVNGDGYADVIVGAPYYDDTLTDQGRAFVYLGSAAGLATPSAWTAEVADPTAYFGYSVATAGDVNGDGYADVIVGAYLYDHNQNDEGKAYIYLGSATGLEPIEAWAAESDQVSAHFGTSVATAGDVNGDGYADVIVGANLYDNGQADEGRAYVFLGSAVGLAKTAGWTAEADQAAAYFGWSVAAAGDVNGDGYADVIVGANSYDNGHSGSGRAFVFLGSPTGLEASAVWTAEGDVGINGFGWSVASAGDVNGDGYADVIIGVPYGSNVQSGEGRAFVYHGSAAGLAPTPAWSAESDQVNANFGMSVATAGDVNGDGYSDVIVGAPSYDNGQSDEGRAFVYYGAAVGLARSPSWTAESNQANANFGNSVATAGDVNGDGFADVIVAAERFNNGQGGGVGGAFVFLGSASGLAASPGWAADSAQGTGFFGDSVSTAGDVNGDGYADVIVGAPGFDSALTDVGRAYVYLGADTGLATSPAWFVEGVQTSESVGASVSTAGDVNGDGFADVIVGAPGYGNGQGNEGGAFVYLGSASGLAITASWSAESDQSVSTFGNAVATAGDVNGDGASEVIIGAAQFDNGQTDEGRAFVYYGNEGPGPSLRPEQRQPADTGLIAPLGAADSNVGFRLRLIGRTPFGRGKVWLEHELKPLGSPLNGTDTTMEAGSTSTGVGGVQLDALATGLSDETVYHWRMRLHYSAVTTPFVQLGRWLTVPINGWQEADLRTLHYAGVIPAGSPGVPLRATKAAPPNITLTWDPSCIPTDTDYAVYEGTIGLFYSHTPKSCSTGGTTASTIAPAAGSTYYLVVPLNPTREGSYGTRSNGGERPAGLSACLPSAAAECP